MPRKRITPPPQNPVDDETQTIPITGRIKELRGEDLTDHQKGIIEEFINREATPKEREAFLKGFANSAELDAVKTQLQEPITKSLRAAHRNRIRQLENEITPASRKAAIESSRNVIAKALERIRQHGTPKNMRHFLNELTAEGLATRTYKAGGTIDRSEGAMRDLLQKTFGIKGKPGRKPG